MTAVPKKRLLTVLYYTVLLKIRKFAGREQIDRQTENREFKIRDHFNPHWIVGGRANKYVFPREQFR